MKKVVHEEGEEGQEMKREGGGEEGRGMAALEIKSEGVKGEEGGGEEKDKDKPVVQVEFQCEVEVRFSLPSLPSSPPPPLSSLLSPPPFTHHQHIAETRWKEGDRHRKREAFRSLSAEGVRNCSEALHYKCQEKSILQMCPNGPK